MRNDFLIALSLANLIFTTLWEKVFLEYSWGTYFLDFPNVNSLKAVMFDVLLLTLMLFGAMRLLRKSTSPVVQIAGRAGFLIVLVIALNSLGSSFPELSVHRLQERLVKVDHFVAGLILGTFLSCAALCARRYVISVAATILVILSPFALIQFGKATWFWQKYRGTVTFAGERQLAPALPAKGKGKPRIVWVVFDELDYRLTFAERPASIRLPELDRLRAQSISASQAFSPAGWTLHAMPSLITGMVAVAEWPDRRDELLLSFDNKKERIGWSTLPNIFSEARKAGFNAGLAGWSHPYCRIIGDLTACSSQLRHWGADGLSGRLSVPEVMLRLASEQLPKTIPFLDRLVDNKNQQIRAEKQRHLQLHLGVMTAAKKLAVDPSLGLVFIHYPVPHPPGIYDRRKDKFSIERSSNYLDNLQLTDRTLGELRHTMEQARLWDDTVVVVTADHPWRSELFRGSLHWTAEEEAVIANMQAPDHRIPYLLKLAGQKQARTYNKSFNTVVTHDLLLAVLRGELASTDSVVEWLDQHRLNQRESVKDDQARM